MSVCLSVCMFVCMFYVSGGFRLFFQEMVQRAFFLPGVAQFSEKYTSLDSEHGMKYFDIVLKNLSSEFVQCDVCLTFLKNMLYTRESTCSWLFSYWSITIIKTCWMLTTGFNSKFNDAVIYSLRTKKNWHDIGQVSEIGTGKYCNMKICKSLKTRKYTDNKESCSLIRLFWKISLGHHLS